MSADEHGDGAAGLHLSRRRNPHPQALDYPHPNRHRAPPRHAKGHPVPGTRCPALWAGRGALGSSLRCQMQHVSGGLTSREANFLNFRGIRNGRKFAVDGLTPNRPALTPNPLSRLDGRGGFRLPSLRCEGARGSEGPGMRGFVELAIGYGLQLAAGVVRRRTPPPAGRRRESREFALR
jgi:hypothetical protein